MDEVIRRLQRAAASGNLDAGRRLSAMSVELRVAAGAFDVFETRLREDVVEEARRLDPDARHVDGVNVDPAWWPVELVVNGRRLVDLFEREFNPHLPAHAVYLPTRHLLGEPYAGPGGWTGPEDTDGKTLLLFCSCGDSLCGRLVADIVVTERSVVWSGLEHRPGPKARYEHTFVFARGAYEAALRDPPA